MKKILFNVVTIFYAVVILACGKSSAQEPVQNKKAYFQGVGGNTFDLPLNGMFGNRDVAEVIAGSDFELDDQTYQNNNELNPKKIYTIEENLKYMINFILTGVLPSSLDALEALFIAAQDIKFEKLARAAESRKEFLVFEKNFSESFTPCEKRKMFVDPGGCQLFQFLMAFRNGNIKVLDFMWNKKLINPSLLDSVYNKTSGLCAIMDNLNLPPQFNLKNLANMYIKNTNSLLWLESHLSDKQKAQIKKHFKEPQTTSPGGATFYRRKDLEAYNLTLNLEKQFPEGEIWEDPKGRIWIPVFTRTLNWIDSKLYCEKRGGGLPLIEEYKELRQYMGAVENTPNFFLAPKNFKLQIFNDSRNREFWSGTRANGGSYFMKSDDGTIQHQYDHYFYNFICLFENDKEWFSL
jgi:hypothetical protein